MWGFIFIKLENNSIELMIKAKSFRVVRKYDKRWSNNNNH